MPSQKNINQLASLKEAFADSKAVLVTGYAGLSSAQQTDLRAKITEAGGQFQVVKNNIIALALKDLTQDDSITLEGQTAIITSNDPVTPTKTLYEFIKANEKPEIKLGVLDGSLISSQEVENLSKLPSREELLGSLVGQLNAPIYGFAQVLRANLQNLVYAIDAIKNQQSTN
jgi:large subunit ribosomal protein L10